LKLFEPGLCYRLRLRVAYDVPADYFVGRGG